MSPTVILHYRVVRRLGAGGMGEIYLARDTRLDRPVALKVMSAELAKDQNQRRRFRTEAKAASGVLHPHICVVFEVGETEDGRPFLAMEYIDGQTLDKILAQRRLKLPEILNLGIGVAEALEAAHARGLVHRDIKPGNLMLDRLGSVKVLDFGLAKHLPTEELAGLITSAAHTRTGMLIGTPQYMSPEQALGHPLDARTDIFSLGVVLYELVAGQRPFLGNTLGETINNIANQPPAPLGLEDPVYSPNLNEIIFRCLEKEREKRYASAKELGAALRKLGDGPKRGRSAPGVQKMPEPLDPAVRDRHPATLLQGLAASARRSHKPAMTWSLGLLLMTLLGAGAWMLLRGSSSKPTALAASPIDQRRSVAVLPFVNLSADKADDYLSDGMTEELLNALTKVKGLRVPGRSSSFYFKGKAGENLIHEVGKQLGVDAVLEGSVRRSGSQIRITAELVNVADGFQLWSDSYDRDMTNIFAIQSEIASRVLEGLKMQWLGAAREPTANFEAYKLYLQGRSLWNRRDSRDIALAVECFNKAIAKDPGYALAYAALADCYWGSPRVTVELMNDSSWSAFWIRIDSVTVCVSDSSFGPRSVAATA